LDAGRWAPSAGNLQPWVFIVVQTNKLMREIAQAALGQMFVLEAPYVIVVCADILRSASRYGQRGAELYSIQDTAAAIQNMLLAAYSLGLGACWIGAFDENEVRGVLGLPKDIRPVALMPLGFAKSHSQTPQRRPLDEVVRWI
jgi:SagB-type dehydrogenase family enzyme